MADEEARPSAPPSRGQVEEEFAIWKKNTPFLYDLISSQSLEWPSLTVQWLHSLAEPQSLDPNNNDSSSSFTVHKLVLGTHTSDDYPNFLMIADARIPKEGSRCPTVPKVEIVKKMNVDGEVNRARCMPQNPTLIAAKTSGSEVYVFDSNKQENTGEKGGSFSPDLILRGHEKEGYGLSWSPFKLGHVLSASNDHKICLWDVSSMPDSKVLDAMSVYQAHEGVVGDVSWHSKNENLFGSVGDDGRLIIWDYRSDKPQQSVRVHEKEVNYLSFNPFNESIVATASSDTTIGIFDLRKLETSLHVLSSHTEEVFQVEWDPNHEAVLASSAADRRLMVWDLTRVGDEQLEGGGGEDGPPELLFSHGGHKDRISDFSWNKNEPWVLSSVADDNSLQVWQMAQSIYNNEEDE